MVEFGFTIGQRRLESLGTDVLLSSDATEGFLTWLKNFAFIAGAESEFQERRLRAKQSMYPYEINSNVILLEAGLEQAVSFTKGCYAGQEVIARIDSQGKTPRLLKFFSASQDACPAIGAQIYRADDAECRRAVGTVMYVIKQKESGFLCSAYVKNDPEILKNSLRLATGELQGLE
jgi:folate-binding protein YgfZ